MLGQALLEMKMSSEAKDDFWLQHAFAYDTCFEKLNKKELASAQVNNFSLFGCLRVEGCLNSFCIGPSGFCAWLRLVSIRCIFATLTLF